MAMFQPEMTTNCVVPVALSAARVWSSITVFSPRSMPAVNPASGVAHRAVDACNEPRDDSMPYIVGSGRVALGFDPHPLAEQRRRQRPATNHVGSSPCHRRRRHRRARGKDRRAKSRGASRPPVASRDSVRAAKTASGACTISPCETRPRLQRTTDGIDGVRGPDDRLVRHGGVARQRPPANARRTAGTIQSDRRPREDGKKQRCHAEHEQDGPCRVARRADRAADQSAPHGQRIGGIPLECAGHTTR